MMKTTAKAPSSPSMKDAPRPKEAARPRESPMAPQMTAVTGKQAAPSVTQPAGNRFRAPPAPSAAPGMPSASRRLDKTP